MVERGVEEAEELGAGPSAGVLFCCCTDNFGSLAELREKKRGLSTGGRRSRGTGEMEVELSRKCLELDLDFSFRMNDKRFRPILESLCVRDDQ